jgi:hypothetical protein
VNGYLQHTIFIFFETFFCKEMINIKLMVLVLKVFFCFCLKGVKDLNSNVKAGLLGK